MISSPMHIAFCVNDHYAEYILVSIKGLLEIIIKTYIK